MYLRSLELQGFKSFPERTKLEFNKGISAVVGPNGSGKSNIGDAMRWVMGESSSKSLRGKTMEDVIFSGTASRSKSGFAQVTITIDNEDRALSEDCDIVSVSRKLYRNGDSEYQINGRQVRRKDVDELFMDTGLGRDGYSIIGQGKIGEIVSSKASDRRQIFDEAAGISKFRSKKRETEEQLLKAEDNLSRLTDILGELEGRIGPLQKQCEKAKQFKVLDEEKSALEISLWVMRLKELDKQQKEFEEKLELLKKEYAEQTDALDEMEEQIEEGFAKSAQAGDRANQLREKIHEVELERSESTKKTAVLGNDIEHLEQRILQINEQIEQSRSSGYFLGTQLEEKKKELEERLNMSEKFQQDISDAEKKLTGAQYALDEQENEIERLGAKINELYLKKSNASFKLETAKNNSMQASESLEALSSEKEERDERRALYEKERAKLKSKTDKLEEDKQELINKIAGFSKLHESKSKKLSSAQESFSENDNELKGIVQRLRILRDLERSMEGFSYSVKFIMKAAEQGRIRGVCGSVAQIISVESKYSTAIETALGAAMQNIAVENEDSAKRGIRLLKDNNAGRATFLPLTSIKGRSLDDIPEGEEGFIEIASDLVSCDTKYKQLISNLLGRIAVAEDLDCASAIAKKYNYKFKIVTLDGQVINAGGSYTGGSTAKSAGILTRKNEIDSLEKNSDNLKQKNQELKDLCVKLSQEVQNLAAELEGLKEETSDIDSELLRAELEMKRVDELVSQLDDSDEKLKENTEKLNSQMLEAERQADEASAELCELEKLIAEGEKKRAEKRDENSDAAEKRRSLSEELSKLRISHAEHIKDTDSCRADIKRIEEAIGEGKVDEDKLAEEAENCKCEIENKKNEIDNIKDSVSGSDDVIKGYEAKIADTIAEQTRLANEAEKLRAEQRGKMNERETLAAELTRTQERRKNVMDEYDKLVGKMLDDYGLARTEAEAEYQPPEDIKSANIRLNELRGKIKALGHVNLGAIEEYAEVSERYDFLTKQLDDVNRSKLELERLAESLTESMRSMFTDSFERISKRFTAIFTELFGGGKASLSLTDPEDVLECGIDINVQPPGKNVKNLMSMSGGETAFVAVCIYFAILSVRPSPFCLLDEIEAALDDVNVSKYASYLHHYTDKTQFITITHRRGTMEEADVIYGVTMIDGVSRLLKMPNGEAQKMQLD